MSQNPYLDTQQILKEVFERYEAMFAHFYAIRKVFLDQPELSLLRQYAEVVLRTDFQNEVRAKFAPVFYQIAQWSPESRVPELLSKIPLIPSSE
jgi:hypothetical protein